MYFLLFLAVCLPAVFGSCNSARCSKCVSEKHVMTGCEWCPTDNVCHDWGSLEDPCSRNELITDLEDCPSDPIPNTSYNQDTATIMMQYASAAYMTDYHVNKTFPDGFKTLGNFTFILPDRHKTPGHAYVGKVDSLRHVVIAFDGTTNYHELMNEALNVTLYDYDAENFPGAEAFGFFLASYHIARASAMPTLLKALNDNPGYEMWVTGHSLGGCIAALYAIEIGSSANIVPLLSGKKPKLYTFGEPRCGNKKLADVANEYLEAYRVVNSNDMVPHLPPCLTVGEHPCSEDWAYHHGMEIWYAPGDHENGNMCWYKECQAEPYGEDMSCSNSEDDMNPIEHSNYWNVLFDGGWCGEWKDDDDHDSRFRG